MAEKIELSRCAGYPFQQVCNKRPWCNCIPAITLMHPSPVGNLDIGNARPHTSRFLAVEVFGLTFFGSSAMYTCSLIKMNGNRLELSQLDHSYSRRCRSLIASRPARCTRNTFHGAAVVEQRHELGGWPTSILA